MSARHELVGEVLVGQDPLDAVGQLLGVAGLEQQRGTRAADELGQSTGVGDDQRGAAGECLERDDAERLVERRNDDASSPVCRGAELVVGDEAGQFDEVADAGDVDLRLEFGGSGDSLHAIAASSSGSISGAHHAGQINMQGSGLLFSDMVTSIMRALNPISETEEYANLECSIIEVRIEDGIDTVEEMAAQLDKLKIIGSGEIDLDTEQLDMTMRTKTREGFGVSIGGVVNSFLAIGGTLSEPALNVDPAGSVTTAGAAVATGGMSVLAKSLWDRLSAEVDICSEEATQ